MAAKTTKAPAKKPGAAKSTASKPKAEPKPAQSVPTAAPAATVHVDNRTRRSGDDALEGGWVDVVSGEHKGLRGAFLSVERYDKKTGYPATIRVRNRDLTGDVDTVVVNYADARPAENYLGGR